MLKVWLGLVMVAVNKMVIDCRSALGCELWSRVWLHAYKPHHYNLPS